MTRGNRAGLARFVGVSPSLALLQSLLYLKGLPLDEVADLLLANSLVIEFSPGDELTRQDDVAEHLFFILSGSVRVTRRDKTAAGVEDSLARVAIAGDILGRYELTFSLSYTSTATAENEVSALCVERSTVERLLYRYPTAHQQTAYQTMVNRLRTMPLLADVDMVILGFLADEIRSQTVKAGTVLYTQNQVPGTLYLIAQGQIELYHPRRTDNRLLLGTGGAFGFPGSVGVTGSSAPDKYGHWAEAKTETTVYELPWRTIRQVGRRFPQANDPEIQLLPAKTISAVSIFAGLSPHEQIQLSGFCSFYRIPQNHPIMQQGDSADSMWILLENSRAVLSALDEENRALPRAPVRGIVTFNETALLAPTPVELTVESEPGSLWLRLHRQDYQRIGQICGPEIVDKVADRLPAQTDDTDHAQRQDYPWLRKDELLVNLHLRHWLALLGQTKVSALAILAGAGLTWLLSSLGFSLWVALGISGLLVILSLIWGVLNYLNDYFIVTNRRIIQQEKVIFFSERRQEALLEQIQRVDVATTFWGNLFNYGTLSVYTAGTTGSIDFDFVGDPDSLRTAIFHHRSLSQQRSSAENKLDIQNALEDRLGLSVDLPGRVYTDLEPSTSEDTAAGLDLWQRLRQFVSVDRSLDWESTERIVWHKHWWVLFVQVALPGLLLLFELLFLAGGFSSVDLLQQLQSTLNAQTLLVSGGLVTLATLGWILWAVADWWNDTYTVTKDRIIDVEKLPLFLSEQRREAQLSDIQDIRLEMNSPIKVMLNFGNIIVQTAAGEGAFTFDHVPNPRIVKEEITRRMIAWRREDERRKAQDRSKDLPDWFEMYNRLEAGQARNVE
ncbi:MAG: cyclic nucleotide-binding domain-containing protein [Caldilineaceae bacterium]|nr:cyclic nucleotide-binding domain-containing protein [Caldilineaceae bacterium]MDE0338457.1 cyclic nucleotide-binding domain-containing protein [Caldilineaceae bacterium]